MGSWTVADQMIRTGDHLWCSLMQEARRHSGHCSSAGKRWSDTFFWATFKKQRWTLTQVSGCSHSSSYWVLIPVMCCIWLPEHNVSTWWTRLWSHTEAQSQTIIIHTYCAVLAFSIRVSITSLAYFSVIQSFWQKHHTSWSCQIERQTVYLLSVSTVQTEMKTDFMWKVCERNVNQLIGFLWQN